MKNVILISILFITSTLFSQRILENKERELALLLNDLRAVKSNAQLNEKNEIFKKELTKVLKEEGAMFHPFSTLTTVGFIDSPDKMLRIVNWNVEQEDGSQRYYGFVIHYDKRKKKTYINELTEDVWGIRHPKGILTAEQWYGGLYYKIIPMKKGRKTVYTVLGWDGLDAMSTMKFVDVLYVNGTNVKFGSPIFKINGETKYRVFYEYSDNATMVLNYEEHRNRIMMDHLSPESPSLKGHRAFYVPDLSYDALVLENGKWVLKEDVIGVNETEKEKTTVQVFDKSKGKNVEVEIENDWKDPSASTPTGGNKHQATLPEETENGTPTKNANPNTPKVNKKDKRQLGEMYQSPKKKKQKKKKKKN